jgi:hypothetical protein
MRYCQVGCDLDGVLADGFTPEEADFAIISGRHTDDWGRTLGQVGATRPIYLRPPHFAGDSPHWKAAMIQAMGITKFYEDDPNQAREIRRICPKCTVCLVRGGRVVEVLS